MENKLFRHFLMLGFCVSVQCWDIGVLTSCEPHADTFYGVQNQLQSAAGRLKIPYSDEREDAYSVFEAIRQKLQEILSDYTSYHNEMALYTTKKIPNGADTIDSDVEKLERELKKFEDEHEITTKKLEIQNKNYDTLNSEVDELQREVQQRKEINAALEGKLKQLKKTLHEAKGLNANLTKIADEKLKA